MFDLTILRLQTIEVEWKFRNRHLFFVHEYLLLSKLIWTDSSTGRVLPSGFFLFLRQTGDLFSDMFFGRPYFL